MFMYVVGTRYGTYRYGNVICVSLYMYARAASSEVPGHYMEALDSLPKKVTEYEKFLNDRLKTDLQAVLESRDSVFSDIAEYMQLRNVIERLQGTKADDTHLKTMVDLGCNFYAQARVPDPSRVCVAVGFGIFMEFSHKEGLHFIDKKVAHLNKKAEELTAKACQIRARIRVVVEALNELQFTTLPSSPPHRPVW